MSQAEKQKQAVEKKKASQAEAAIRKQEERNADFKPPKEAKYTKPKKEGSRSTEEIKQSVLDLVRLSLNYPFIFFAAKECQDEQQQEARQRQC